MNQTFAQPSAVKTVAVPEKGARVRIWLTPQANLPWKPAILEGEVYTATVFPDGSLNRVFVWVSPRQLVPLTFNEIGSIELI